MLLEKQISAFNQIKKMKAKYQCEFCGVSNTKIESITQSSGFLGLGSSKVGERETIDPNAPPFYRCKNCGRVLCKQCAQQMGSFKKETSFIFDAKKWTECPKCGDELILLK